MPQISPPEPLNTFHQVEEFDSGELVLDQWLKTKARRNEQQGASRTYVVCVNQQVIAYYCLAAGSIELHQASGKVRRNMPDPIPVMVLGRLAVHKDWQAQGIGKGLIKDAVLRTLEASGIIGIRAIVVHALNERAKSYYIKLGLKESHL